MRAHYRQGTSSILCVKVLIFLFLMSLSRICSMHLDKFELKLKKREKDYSEIEFDCELA